ncbi:MAG: ParB/RepB/Spo0J family partition protein [Algicola sp.]|nr:ParB/RepB/Spo0J family partition protein [Algicola sp.]
MSAKKRGLGRGLDALLTPKKPPITAEEVEHDTENTADGSLRIIALKQLVPGKYQPRKDMSETALEELSNSIKAQGIIQPIVVRKMNEGKFEIIAGERRWRAAKLADLKEIPCLIKDVADESAVAIALIENIQREDLNAMEEAVALQRLMTEFDLTHQAVADAVGKSRTAVSNLLRLNSLVDEVKTLLERGDIEMGHARALLSLEADMQEDLARQVAEKGLTVRETEALVKRAFEPAKERVIAQKTPDIELLEQQLTQNLQAPIAIKHNAKGKGKLTISYKNLAELDKIIDLINH